MHQRKETGFLLDIPLFSNVAKQDFCRLCSAVILKLPQVSFCLWFFFSSSNRSFTNRNSSDHFRVMFDSAESMNRSEHRLALQCQSICTESCVLKVRQTQPSPWSSGFAAAAAATLPGLGMNFRVSSPCETRPSQATFPQKGWQSSGHIECGANFSIDKCYTYIWAMTIVAGKSISLCHGLQNRWR